MSRPIAQEVYLVHEDGGMSLMDLQPGTGFFKWTNPGPSTVKVQHVLVTSPILKVLPLLTDATLLPGDEIAVTAYLDQR
jgi:hypothetical protein